MADIFFRATWMASPDVPLSGPAGANIPEITIVRNDTGAVAQSATDMTEQTNIPGSFVYVFTPPDDTITYSARADGDPAVAGQVQTGTRFAYGIGDARASDADSLVQTNLDVTVSSRSSHSAADAALAVRDQTSLSAAPAGSIGRSALLSMYQSERGPSIFIDTFYGTAGSVVGVNGTPDNPVSNESDARLLADALSIRRYHVVGFITLSTPPAGPVIGYQDWEFYGAGQHRSNDGVNFGGQDCFGATFVDLRISGTCSNASFGGGFIGARGCEFANAFEVHGVWIDCVFTRVTALPTVDFGASQVLLLMQNCAERTRVGATSQRPVLRCGGTNDNDTRVFIHGYRGHLTFEDITQANTELDATFTGADVTFDASCTAGVNPILRGTFEVTNNGTLTLDTTGRIGEVNDDYLGQPTVHGSGLWDAISAGATDWTVAEREQIRSRLSLDGTQTDPTTDLGDLETLLTRLGIGNAETEYEDATSTTPGSIKSPPVTGTRLSRTVTQTAANKVKVGP